MVTHSIFMKALTASSVKYNAELEEGYRSPYDLVDGYDFDNC